MKHYKGFAYLSIAPLLSFLFVLNAASQESNVSRPKQTEPPQHPITEKQVRTYLNVCHVPSLSHQLLHEKMEDQRKQLPEWYPQYVWDEIEQAIDQIDLPTLAVPIYQKYLSEDDARWIIRFFSTSQGQKLLQSYLAINVPAQRTGATVQEAHEKTMAQLAREESAEIARIVGSMNPEDIRLLQSRVAHMNDLLPAAAQMREELAQASVNRQIDLMREIAARHEWDITNAEEQYEARHSSTPGSKPH